MSRAGYSDPNREATDTLGSETLDGVSERLTRCRGERLGRYWVLDLIGSGAMGQVYVAYDPKLDRKVALKVLPAGQGRSSSHQARLIREARALARLSHPNVLSVFDAEVVGDQIFIATEYVIGKTYSAWLRSERAKTEGAAPERLLEVSMQAGRGLAAAHEAGLVHRDFKGSNVMVADDGRVLVLDFGLARRVSRPEADGSSGQQPESEPVVGIAVSDPDLTSTGAVLGTPAFMSPEQRRGEPVGPATDQYSFCAVLFQALTGVLPLDARFSAAMSALSTPLRRILTRGLDSDPCRRYPSMTDLLDDLGRIQRRRRMEWAAVLGLPWLLALGVLLWWGWPPAARVDCDSGAAMLQTVWNGGRRAELEVSIFGAASSGESSSRRHGDQRHRDVWRSVVSGLDRYAGRWGDFYRARCEATHFQGRQSRELLDLQMDCLDQRKRELDAALGVLGDGKPGRLEAAPGLVAALVGTEACADTRALRSPDPLPEDPESRAELDQLRDDLAAAKALWLVGDYERGFEQARALVVRADGFDHWPSVAEIRLEEARFLESLGRAEEADRALVDTLLAAQAGGHARVAAQALMRRVRVLGYQQGRTVEARRSAAQAEGVLQRLTEPTLLAAELDELRGLLEVREGRYAEARGYFERSLRAKERLLDKDHLGLATSRSRLGDVLLSQGRFSVADDHLRRSLAIYQKHLGKSHPNVANVLSQLGVVAMEEERFEQALHYHRWSLRIRRQAFGDDHLQVAMSLTEAAGALAGLGRFDDAIPDFGTALELFERRLGEHPFVAVTLANQANAYLRQGRATEAVPLYRRALAIQEKAYGKDHPLTAEAAFNLGESLTREGRAREAFIPLSRAADVWQRAGDADRLADAWTTLGKAHLELGEISRARALLEKALESRSPSSRRPDLRAKNEFALARALRLEGQCSGRSRVLAESALARYRRNERGHQHDIEIVEHWLEVSASSAEAPSLEPLSLEQEIGLSRSFP